MQQRRLHYNRFRYYDPKIGRFISQDLIGLMGGENLFSYAPNSINLKYPSGLDYRSTFWNAVNNGVSDGARFQVHYIIPQVIYDENVGLMNCAGVGKNDPDNLIGLPRKAEYVGSEPVDILARLCTLPVTSTIQEAFVGLWRQFPSCLARQRESQS